MQCVNNNINVIKMLYKCVDKTMLRVKSVVKDLKQYLHLLYALETASVGKED